MKPDCSGLGNGLVTDAPTGFFHTLSRLLQHHNQPKDYRMNIDEYMAERVDDQIRWYCKKSSINKKLHVRFNSTVIVFSAMIPFVSGFELSEFLPFVTLSSAELAGLFGVITASLTGIIALMKFQEKWTVYRVTGEALQREKLLFKTGVSPYHGGDSYPRFVHNIEKILGSENTQWSATVGPSEGGTAETA